jgi:hypothetical protein
LAAPSFPASMTCLGGAPPSALTEARSGPRPRMRAGAFTSDTPLGPAVQRECDSRRMRSGAGMDNVDPRCRHIVGQRRPCRLAKRDGWFAGQALVRRCLIRRSKSAKRPGGCSTAEALRSTSAHVRGVRGNQSYALWVTMSLIALPSRRKTPWQGLPRAEVPSVSSPCPGDCGARAGHEGSKRCPRH